MGFPAANLLNACDTSGEVSIPNRDLWVFRRVIFQEPSTEQSPLFQSLIGIYGFSGASPANNAVWGGEWFQSLIGIYGFSGSP